MNKYKKREVLHDEIKDNLGTNPKVSICNHSTLEDGEYTVRFVSDYYGGTHKGRNYFTVIVVNGRKTHKVGCNNIKHLVKSHEKLEYEKAVSSKPIENKKVTYRTSANDKCKISNKRNDEAIDILVRSIQKVLLLVIKLLWLVVNGVYFVITRIIIKSILLGINKIFQGSNRTKDQRNKDVEHQKSIEVDGKTLDIEQTKAAISLDDTLIVAGAGCGKTLTIAGKVKYMVEELNIKPESILVLSYTVAAVNELKDRINQRLGINADCRTFHSLSLEVLNNNSDTKYSLNPADEFKRFNVVYNSFLDHVVVFDNKIRHKILNFIANYLYDRKDYYQNRENVEDPYESGNVKGLKKLISLNGTKVRSIEELRIANYLYLHNIKYTYEKQYPHIEDRYCPDFYLDEYDIYYEHFALGKNMHPPGHWNKESKRKYLDSYTWKLELHENMNTKLIKTYSFMSGYDDGNNILLLELEKQLKLNNVFIDRDFYENQTKNLVLKNTDKFVFGKLVEGFINNFKVNNYSLSKLQEMKKKSIRTKLFVEIMECFVDYYQRFFEENKWIDFNDIINKASQIYKQNPEITTPYKHIIIDEFQDISKSRLDLILQMKNKNNASLTCVGDDWQSIYRFSGSSVEFFLSFDKFVTKNYQTLKINKTYRNPQQLIELASKFVMKNNRQINKELKSDKDIKLPCRVVIYEGSSLDSLVHSLIEISETDTCNKSVSVLARYNFEIERMLKTGLFRKTGHDIYQFEDLYNLNIRFMTIHKSKGLEDDYVIMYSVNDSLFGFPSQIENDPILEEIQFEEESYIDYVEERRLFYVALTRTKNKVYVCAHYDRPSQFILDLLNVSADLVDLVKATTQELDIERCDKCNGIMTQVKHFDFKGCENYPYCQNTISITKNQMDCDEN